MRISTILAVGLAGFVIAFLIATGGLLWSGWQLSKVVLPDDRLWMRSETGDMDGDGLEDVARIVERKGDDGARIFFVSLMPGDPDLPITGSVFIGTEVIIGPSRIVDGVLSVQYMDRPPWEPSDAVRSVMKTKLLRYEDGMLKDVRTASLTEDAAYVLVEEADGPCDEGCTMLDVVVRDGVDGVWYVESYRDGLADDSVRASRSIRRAYETDGEWRLGEVVVQEWRCQPGRGHEELSDELCL